MLSATISKSITPEHERKWSARDKPIGTKSTLIMQNRLRIQFLLLVPSLFQSLLCFLN